MTDVTVKQLASEIGTDETRLLSQLADAGIKKSASDSVTEQEKENLLVHLKKQHGDDTEGKPQRMTLNRKTKSTLSVGSGSKAKQVQVEVRKKRTYVKASDVELKAQAEAEAKAAEEARIAAEAQAVEVEKDFNNVEFEDLGEETTQYHSFLRSRNS